MPTETPDRSGILLPLRGEPSIIAAERSLYEQANRVCGGIVTQIPASEWKQDRFHAMIASVQPKTEDAPVNALASKVFGGPVHGTCILAKRPARDEDMYGTPHRADRYMQPFDPQTAREALASLMED